MSLLFVLSISISMVGCAQQKSKINWIGAIQQNMSSDFEETPIFRLPVMVICNNGHVIIGAEAKSSKNKKLFYAIAISKDGGKTFCAKRSHIPMMEMVYDSIHDRVFSFTGGKFYASDDHGESWYDYRSEVHIVKPDSFDIISMSPTSGIQLKNGILAVPMRFIRKKRDKNGNKIGPIEKTINYVLYSKDYGKTWEQTPTTSVDIIADEVTIVEYLDNQIMLNARGGTEYVWDKTNNGRRVFVPLNKSKDSISEWKIDGWILEPTSDGIINDPICHASLIKATVGKKTVGLFCNPDMPSGDYEPRRNLCLRVSKDFKHWNRVIQLTPDKYPVLGYSAMAYNGGRLFFAYEDKKNGILFCDLGPYKEEIIRKMK